MKTHRPSHIVALVMGGLVAAIASGGPARAASGASGPGRSVGLAAADYSVRSGPAALPDVIAEGLRPTLRQEALTITGPQDDPVLDLWFVRRLAAAAPSREHPLVNYGALAEGSVLGAMQVHREHRDFRDQPVPPGVYVLRYLRQPQDGKHLGETTYRDFAVLVPPADAASAEPRPFDVILGQALQLNTHPLVLGLWPASHVATVHVPAVVNFDSDKWALRVDLPREDGDPLAIGLVVAGNERSYY